MRKKLSLVIETVFISLKTELCTVCLAEKVTEKSFREIAQSYSQDKLLQEYAR